MYLSHDLGYTNDLIVLEYGCYNKLLCTQCSILKNGQFVFSSFIKVTKCIGIFMYLLWEMKSSWPGW